MPAAIGVELGIVIEARLWPAGHPVLCTGDDFAATDIAVVRPGTAPGGRPV
jgi:hypothetical protein